MGGEVGSAPVVNIHASSGASIPEDPGRAPPHTLSNGPAPALKPIVRHPTAGCGSGRLPVRSGAGWEPCGAGREHSRRGSVRSRMDEEHQVVPRPPDLTTSARSAATSAQSREVARHPKDTGASETG